MPRKIVVIGLLVVALICFAAPVVLARDWCKDWEDSGYTSKSAGIMCKIVQAWEFFVEGGYMHQED